MNFFRVLLESVIKFPVVILIWHTPSMMRASMPLGVNEVYYLSGLYLSFMIFGVYDAVGFIQSHNLWPYAGLFLAVMFVITFKQTEKHIKEDAEYAARCEAERLERIAKNPWKPYSGEPVAEDVKVNIELKNSSILWRVPSSSLIAMADDIKLWMPAPPRSKN